MAWSQVADITCPVGQITTLLNPLVANRTYAFNVFGAAFNDVRLWGVWLYTTNFTIGSTTFTATVADGQQWVRTLLWVSPGTLRASPILRYYVPERAAGPVRILLLNDV